MTEHRVGIEQAATQLNAYEAVQTRLETSGQETVNAEAETQLFNRYLEAYPPDNFGALSLRTVPKAFQSQFSEALKNGQVEDFFAQSLGQPGAYAEIYTVKALDSQGLSPADTKKWLNHQPDALAQTRQHLEQVLIKIEDQRGILPDNVLDEYRAKTELWIRYTDNALSLANPEMTPKQKSNQGWLNILDIEASQQAGTAILRHEALARQILQNSSESTQPEITLAQALSFYNLSTEESRYLDLSGQETNLAGEALVRFFNILLNRLGLVGQEQNNWQVISDKSAKSITIAAKSRTIKIPEDRQISPELIPFIPAHDMTHVLRGHKGFSQRNCQVLGVGMEGYLDTEEGLTVLTEMIMGQPFGHIRQQEFAARYLAAAMMLKTAENTEGEIVPQYSVQDVYDQLVNYGLDQDTAASTVWRVVRGSSLKHQVTQLNLETDTGSLTLAVAEAYVKDEVYFRGMLEVLEWVKNHIPVYPGARQELTTGAPDFSDRTLARIGYAAGQTDLSFSDVADLRQKYELCIKAGREVLFNLLDYLSPGKVTLESIADPNSQWNNLLTREGLPSARQILEPADITPLLGD